MNFILVEEVL